MNSFPVQQLKFDLNRIQQAAVKASFHKVSNITLIAGYVVPNEEYVWSIAQSSICGLLDTRVTRGADVQVSVGGLRGSILLK